MAFKRPSIVLAEDHEPMRTRRPGIPSEIGSGQQCMKQCDKIPGDMNSGVWHPIFLSDLNVPVGVRVHRRV